MSKFGRKLRRAAGVTLIEVVIAVSLFAVCIVGACGLVLSARQLSDRSRSHYTAVNVAKNRIEKARSFDFDQLSLMVESNVVVNGNGNPALQGHYRRTTQISSVQSNLAEIVVAVEIRDRITLAFDGEAEVVRTYLADILEP